MKITFTHEEAQQHFLSAMCNGLGYISGYGLELVYEESHYKKAKKKLDDAKAMATSTITSATNVGSLVGTGLEWKKKKEEEDALITSNNNLYTLSANSTTQDYSAEELERLKQALTLNLQVHANQLKMLINSK